MSSHQHPPGWCTCEPAKPVEKVYDCKNVGDITIETSDGKTLVVPYEVYRNLNMIAGVVSSTDTKHISFLTPPEILAQMPEEDKVNGLSKIDEKYYYNIDSNRLTRIINYYAFPNTNKWLDGIHLVPSEVVREDVVTLMCLMPLSKYLGSDEIEEAVAKHMAVNIIEANTNSEDDLPRLRILLAGPDDLTEEEKKLTREQNELYQ